MAKNKSLEKARAAYSKNKNTKYTWKDGKKSEKKPKKKKKEAASSYGQVEKKTQTAGKQGKENKDKSGMYSPTSPSRKTTAKKPATTARHANAPANSRGKERKKGVEKARPTAQKVTKITTTPLVSYAQHTAKNATDAAGWASKHAYRATEASHRARKNNAVTKNDRLNYAQKLQRAKQSAEMKDIKAKTHVRTEEEKFKGVKPTEFEENQKKYTKKFHQTSKKLEKAQEKTLRSGAKAMGLSDEKKYEIPDIPIVNHFLPSTKAQQKAAEDQKNEVKKTALKNAGLDKETFNADLAELDATAKANGVTPDTVLENGQTYAEYRAELIRNAKKEKKAILDDIDKNIDTSKVGKVSASDIYVGANKMADELADYMIPYIGTTGKALKAADKILKATKGAKAGKNIVKIGDDAAKGLTAEGKKVVREAVAQGYKEGKSLDDIIKGVTKKVKSADFKQNVKRQLIANALQDATIGTTIDALKLKQQGLSGKEFAKNMAEYAAMNAAFGAPLSFAMGRTGKAGRQLISEDIAHSANSIATLTKAEGVELGMLMKKADRGIIAGAEQARLVELQDKALGGKSAITNGKGKVNVTKESNAETVLENLAPADAKEYLRLKAKVAGGTLQPHEVGRLVKLQEGVEAAYAKTEKNAHAAIDIKGRTIKSKDQTSLENAVKFFSRTNDKANLAKAEKSLEIAKTQTRKLNESLGNATDLMTEKTGIKYKWVDDEEMTRLTGESGNQGFTDPSTGEIIINRDSPQAWQTVLGHETGHVIKMSDDEAFKSLGEELQKYAEELGEFGELEASMRRRYPEYQIKEGDSEAIIREKEANFQEEMTAEMLGKYIFGEDDKYLKKLAGEQPTTLQRIVAYIKELIAKTKNKELVERLTKMQDDAFKAIEEAKKVDWEKRGLEEVWAVRITDEMRDSIREKGQRRFSRAGKNAEGANKPMAELAENLYDNGRGLSRAEIKRLTGWDVDTDGKAKFEFSDKDMKLKFKMKDIRDMDEARLEDVIEHGEMFKYYPKFKNVSVQFVKRSEIGAEGEFLPIGDGVLYVAKGQTKAETENTILHELQHAIQEEEGFASGASPEFYEDVWRNMTEELNRYKEDLPNGVATDDYGAIDIIRSYDGDEVATKYERLLNARNELRGQFKGYGFRGNEAADKLVESGKVPYANTKGEIEARETEARRDKSQEWLDEHPREPDKNEIFREKYDKYYRKFSRAKNSKKDTTLDGEIQSILKDKHLKSGSEKALEEDLRAVAKLIGEEKVDEAIAKTEEIVKKHMEIDEYEHVDNAIDQNVKELIKSAPINISELGNGTIAHKLENIGMTREDVPYWVQLRSKKGGMPLDRVYQQLSSERPDLFPPDLTHEDKLKAIIEAATPQASAYRKPQDWIDGERQELAVSIFSKVADGVYADKRAVESAKGIETARAEVKAESKLTEGEVKGSEQQAIGGFEETANTIEEPKQTKKPEAKKQKKPEDTRTEVQKLRESKYVSKEVKSALDNIEEVGLFTEKAEKAAKKYNELDKKIAGKYKHIENAKNKEYPTEAEKTAHIAELEDDIRVLKGKQTKVAGEIEDMAKMKKTDPNKTWEQERAELDHNRKVNKSDPAAKLKQEDSWIKDKWTSLRRLWEDSLIDVERTAKGVKQDPQLRGEILTAANRVRNSASMTNFWVTKGRRTFDNKVGGKPLDEIFPKSLIKDEKKYADFQEYLVMKHVEARHNKGTDIYADVTPEKAQKIIDGLEERYAVLDKDGNPVLDKDGNPVKSEIEAWADEVYAYLKDLQQYRVDSGILTKEAAEQFAEDYPFYVPTNRARDDEPIDFFTGGLSNQIRTAKGGDAPVLDMYAQLYTATNKTIHAAEENNMLNLYFRAKGVTKEQLKNEQLPDLEHAVINATVNKKTGAAKVSFFVDGVPVEYPCSHQLALGLRELDGMEFERLMKAAKVATLYGKPFKALITDWNLVFGVRNGMRDIQQAVVNSKDTRFFGSSFGAAAHSIANKNSPYRKAYASMGGEHAQLVSYDAVAKNMGLEKGKIDKFHETIQDFVDASVNINGREVHTNVIHYIEGINGAIEMMPRMCEFIGTIRKDADAILKKKGSSLKELRNEVKQEVQALEKEGKIGQTEIPAEVENRLAERILDMVGKDTLDTAMRNANDITLNFGRSGVLGKALNMGFVPYLNPSIQGLSKLARLFTEAGQEGGWKALASIGMKLSVFTLAPAVWNEVALRNNEDYQNLNTRDKDNNFFIALGDGKFIKIPKPRENAVLAEPVEYGLRYFFDKTEYAFFDWDKMKLESDSLWDKIPLTDEGKQAFRTAVDNIGIINPMTSNMVSPLWQTFHNKTWYGGDIESAYEIENKKVKDRYDSGTTGLAIALGKTRGAQALNLSPRKIDNILDSYTGMIYNLWLSQRTEEAKTRGNYLVRTMASQFTKDAVFSNKLSTKAWDKIDGMTEEEQQKYKGTYMYDAFKYDDAIDRITADKTMTNEEKMTAKRELRKKKNELNRAAIDGTANKSNPLPDIAKYLGATETLENFLPEQKDKKGRPVDDDWESYFKRYEKANNYDGMTEKQKEKASKAFLDVYSLGVKGQKIATPDSFHDQPKWTMTGVAIEQSYKNGKINKKQADMIAKSCDVWENAQAASEKYVGNDGNVIELGTSNKRVNKTMDKVPDWGIDTNSGLWKGGYSKSMNAKGGTIAMSLATDKDTEFKDRSYYIENYSDPMCLEKMNAARGFAKRYKHKTKEVPQLALQADALGDSNTYLKNDEIIEACKAQDGWSDEERAMGYILLGGNPKKNPFGEIGDYSLDGDTGIEADEDENGKGGRGRRGHRRRGHRGGGGGGGGKTPFTPVVNTAGGAAKQKLTKIKVTDVTKPSDYTKPSNLNDAYRKKVRKLREQTRKRN